MASPLDSIRDKHILFLTTSEYSLAPSISDPYSTPVTIAALPVQNKRLAEALCLAGADVRFSSWRFPSAGSTRATLCRFDIIVFLCCDRYIAHIEDFYRFLDETLIPLTHDLPRLKVVNDPRLLRWNGTKEYLKELHDEGFRICRTKFSGPGGLDVDELKEAIEEFAGGSNQPLVLKPTVGLGAESLYLVEDPSSITELDLDNMEGMLELQGQVGSVMIQDFHTEYGTLGEYSIVYLGGVFSHAVLNRPHPTVTTPYGGGIGEVAQGALPEDALQVGERLHEFLEKKFGKGVVGYMRLDGLVAKDDGGFVLTKVDLIEPEIWLHMDPQRVQRFATILLDEGRLDA